MQLFQPNSRETTDVACGRDEAFKETHDADEEGKEEEEDGVEIVSSSESAAVVILKQVHKEAMERYNKQDKHFKALVSPTNRLMPLYVNWVEGKDMSLNIMRSYAQIQRLLKNKHTKFQCAECYGCYYCKMALERHRDTCCPLLDIRCGLKPQNKVQGGSFACRIPKVKSEQTV